MPATTTPLTKRLVLCGAIAGPLFLLAVLIQDYAVPGFDPRVYPLSLLSLGTWGWVQIANFALAGALNLCYAVGLWRSMHPGRGGTWGPILIGAYGLGLIAVAVFRSDPANGWPPGAIKPSQPTGHGIGHGLGGLFVFLMLAAALAVFARYFLARKERGWALYCGVSAALLLIIFFGGIGSEVLIARALRLATLIGWMAASLVAVKLLSGLDAARAV
jgi:hypothetical protein